MKIFVTGTRGLPNIPGGIEKHCQELYPRIARRGHEITVSARKPYVDNKVKEWEGIRLLPCFAPRKKSLEAIIHTLISVVKARWYSPDIVHIHGIGPSLLTPFAKLVGLKVVITNHGPDYDREKWGRLAKTVLKLGEKMGGRFADEIITISPVIREIVLGRCDRASHLIPNGVNVFPKSLSASFLDSIGVGPNGYLLAVARFVPEKGLHDLIEAFVRLDSNYNLVLVGDADHETSYSRGVRELAHEDDRIKLTGYITGDPLHQLFSHARLFVLPSYHEGLPIALLEAMSYGLSVLVSDIPANKQVDLPEERYFQCGNVNDLKTKIENLLESPLTEEQGNEIRRAIEREYDWEKIADQTIAVYEKTLNG